MATKKIVGAILLFLVLAVIGIAIKFSALAAWRAHTSITHSLIQSIATIIALFCGAAALYRFYSGKQISGMMLFLGIGFLGTAIIDAYHTIVTMEWFIKAFPRIPASVVEWSWLSTRVYLAVYVILSLWALYRNYGAIAEQQIHPKRIYLLVGSLTLLVLIVFVLIRVPYPTYPLQFFSRPLEYIPGILFLIALIGYIKQGSWKTDKLCYWLVLSLITNVCAQFFYIGLAPHTMDFLYLTAHVVKILSYLMVYIAVSE